MPVISCGGGRWKVGVKGKCIYTSKASADRAYKGYLFKKEGDMDEVTVGLAISPKRLSRKKRKKKRKGDHPSYVLRPSLSMDSEESMRDFIDHAIRKSPSWVSE